MKATYNKKEQLGLNHTKRAKWNPSGRERTKQEKGKKEKQSRKSKLSGLLLKLLCTEIQKTKHKKVSNIMCSSSLSNSLPLL